VGSNVDNKTFNTSSSKGNMEGLVDHSCWSCWPA